MSDFRRFIIGVAEFLQIIGMIAATIGGGMAGKSIAQAMPYMNYNERDAFIVLFTVIGGVVGFAISTTAAAILFAVSESAKHNKAVAELLQRNLDRAFTLDRQKAAAK